MRTRLIFLALFLLGFSLESEARLSKIRPGMTRTDVAIELGKPAQIRYDDEAMFWIYPASETKVCTIKFVDQKVTQDAMTCDDSEPSRKIASQSQHLLPKMNSEEEYQGRVQRYCGIPPTPQKGCKILPQCVNGEWPEVCTPVKE